MATHNFQIFDESMNDTMSDIDYQSDSQRTSGVIPGVADPLLHNKLYRQCSVMAYAIAQVIVARGYNASDSDPVALVNAIQRAFAFSVNGNVPNASGAVTAVRPIDAWPVGSLFMTFRNVNPSSLLGGGTWTQIKGKYLLAADTGNPVDGTTTVGAMTKDVPLKSHTHSFTISSSGAHTHSFSDTSTAAGGHTHTISTNGNHYHGAMGEKTTLPSLYGFYNNSNNHQGAQGDSDNAIWKTSTDGAHTHTASSVSSHTHNVSGTTGSSSHTHSGTTVSAGGSASFNVQPLSIYVYMWRRTA